MLNPGRFPMLPHCLPCRVPRGAATLPHRLPLRSIPPPRFACGSSHSRGHGRPRSVRKSSRLRGKCLSMDCIYPQDCICSDITNLSAHLHRLPTPPPYLRQMRLLHGRVRRCWVLDDAVAKQGRRCWVANNAAGCPWHSSCKSPRTLQKCKLLITRQLAFRAVLGEHKLSLPSTRLKVNQLCIRCLCFGGVRGDLQEGHCYASRC